MDMHLMKLREEAGAFWGSAGPQSCSAMWPDGLREPGSVSLAGRLAPRQVQCRCAGVRRLEAGPPGEIRRTVLKWAWQGSRTATHIALQLRAFVASGSLQMNVGL